MSAASVETAVHDDSEALAEQHIQRLIETAPPLTGDRRMSLAAMLLAAPSRQQATA